MSRQYIKIKKLRLLGVPISTTLNLYDKIHFPSLSGLYFSIIFSQKSPHTSYLDMVSYSDRPSCGPAEVTKSTVDIYTPDPVPFRHRPILNMDTLVSSHGESSTTCRVRDHPDFKVGPCVCVSFDYNSFSNLPPIEFKTVRHLYLQI